ncbi:MAG: type II toxin-antitoxin system VapC family toxin [Promethearchaeota archaeon]|nr:MAG: type II toxin-antitoxin system VapC family toxin [Candidatus Lokiarchaeota archaeon]
MGEVGKNLYLGINMIIMDSNACIDFLDGNQELKEILDNNIDIIGITTISVYEINIGLEITKRKKSKLRYDKLKKSWNVILNNAQILSLGLNEAKQASKIYDDLYSQGCLIDDNDILIAGIMLSNRINKIITRNIKHFERIKQLKIFTY